MDPTALLARGRPDLAGSFPEAERAVSDRQFRPHIEPAPFQIEQQITPILRTFPYAVGEADEFLAALRRRADQHQNALLLVFKPGLQIVPSAQT